MNSTLTISRYHLRANRLSPIIFSIVMLALMLLSVILGFFLSDTIHISCTEINIFITIAVCGLNAFREPFYFSLQNGVPRIRLFHGTVLAGAALAAIFALLEHVFFLLMHVGGLVSDNVIWDFIFPLLYGRAYPDHTSMQMHISLFMFNFSANFMLFTIGYFITTAYYRMNKMMKTLISVCIPVLFLVIFPLVDQLLLNGRVFSAFIRLFIRLFGLSTMNPWCGIATLLGFTAVLAALSWLLVRRAIIKG